MDYALELAPPSDSVHTIGGTAFHETVQEWLELFYGDADETEFDLKQDFKKRLKREFEAAKAEFEDVDADPTTARELAEYCRDTFPIFDELRERKNFLFEPEDTELVGIEEPVEEEVAPGIGFVGYLDVVFRVRGRDEYIVMDIKTSTKGWDKWKKQDVLKTNQLAAYKDYWARLMGVDPGNIFPRFLICQRNLGDYDNRHIELFVPPSGSERRQEIRDWTDEALDKGFDGTDRVTEPELEKRPDKFTCAFCPFSDQFGDVGGCDQNGETFDDYPEGMRPYIDDKWIK